MSIKKPIIKVTKKCPECEGVFYIEECKICKGNRTINIARSNVNFRKYYIENLQEVITYFTRLYRDKHKEAQEYLEKLRKYYKELDKIVNK